jgi:hypothetical protein
VNRRTLVPPTFPYSGWDGESFTPSEEGKMRSFDFVLHADDFRPRMRLPIGTALVGALFAANMTSAVLSLISLS